MAGGDTMSKIYDYNEYQDQRVKVTYTNKRQYKKEDIIVHSWHTIVYIKEFPDVKFNSVAFEEIE